METLDLHKTRHADVKQKVIHFIEDNWNTNTEARIITGHSPRMKDIVKEVLSEYDLKYSIGGLFGMDPAIITIELP